MRPRNDVAAACRRGSGWDKNRAGYRDRFSLQSGRAVQKSEGVAVTGPATQERPDPDDRPRLPGDLRVPNIVKCLSPFSAEV